jgi:predicted kinase
MSHKNKFIAWFFNQFTNDPLFVEMTKMVEESPWHRESNVGIHTTMVVTQYISRAIHQTWETNEILNDGGRQFLLGAFAAAFHDAAKPTAVIYKNSEERGDYKAFHGHEKLSARLWEDWAVRNWEFLKETFNFVPFNIYDVGWMIENHLPWGLKHKDKLANLARTVYVRDIDRAFNTLLLSDTFGRISDDAEEKQRKSIAWVEDFEKTVTEEAGKWHEEATETTYDTPILMMPIAPSGAGKSTLYDRDDTGFLNFSWDKERVLYASEYHDFSGMSAAEIYAIAWPFSTIEHKSEFAKVWQHNFTEMVKKGANIFADNTNLSKKIRRFFLTLAKHHGYRTIAVLMPITEDTLFVRQTTREDKNTPPKSVRQQYNALQLPSYGEFDDIVVMPPQV